ncbi:PH domain-containing protein [Natronococcus sp. A-GB1]|uniref:PH domain-containing protein n=1 Tax=Natronococcus sp. A-GB1 TaxID=3037648 RepID=UPI00241CC035|nr:PH domain-containing protein [Natronococcus sp. A-GB1]MDG5759370.1 PH domain-containing protein [Natronococcus sp. A-GB1]
MNRLHPFSAAVYALRYGLLWLWVPFFLVTALAGAIEVVNIAWLPVAALLGFLSGAAYGIVYYYRFEYGITPDTFDVASGVIARRSREIPYRRIQNVDVRQGVLQRVLGLAVVTVETAGGGHSEAALQLVSKSEADRLQHQIRRRTAGVDADDPDRPTSEASEDSRPLDHEPLDKQSSRVDGTAEASPASETRSRREPTEPSRKRLFALDSRELLLYSLTTLRPAALAAVGFLFFFATDTVLDFLVTLSQPFGGPQDLQTGDTQSYGVLTVVSMVNGIVITYLVSVAYTFATYYDFRLGRVDEDFVYERGLLQRYSGSIPAEKVQSVTITDNPLQRLIDYAGLWVETAGYGPDSSGGSQSAVPMARAAHVHRFAENLTHVETPAFASPPPIARRRYLVRYSLIAAGVVAAALALAQVTPLERWYLAAVVFVAVPPAAHLRYVNLGYYVGEDHLVIRRGFWRRRTTVIPYFRIQTVSTRRSIFQRRLGIASLVVDTASSRTLFWDTPTIYDVDLEDARGAHRTGRKRLQSALRERARTDDASFSVDFT